VAINGFHKILQQREWSRPKSNHALRYVFQYYTRKPLTQASNRAAKAVKYNFVNFDVLVQLVYSMYFVYNVMGICSPDLLGYDLVDCLKISVY